MYVFLCNTPLRNYSITEILYYFGDNDREGWNELFRQYKFPRYEIPSLKPEISFGMAGMY